MKKLFLMMGVIPLIVLADKETVNGIEWTYSVSDGIATVGTGAGVGLWIPDLAIPKGTVGAIAIPSVLGGCPVTRIDVGAFYGCNKLTAVTIPAGVTRIGEHAFDGCCALTNVTVEGAIMEVGFRAFAECVSISCLCFKEAPERIDKTAFWNCNKSAIMIDDLYIPGETGYVEDTYRGMGVRNVVIGEGIESIGASAFEGCWCVTNIVFPDTLRSIYSRAFKGCIGLTEITLPERVTDVDYEVFSDCSNLVSVTFLSNGDHLRVSDPFVGCVNLTQLNIRVLSSMLSNTFRFSDGLCNPLTVKVLEPCDELPDCWAISCSFMKELNLPDGLVRIGESAIADCRVLESVRLPMSLQTIDDSAFDACMQLRKLVLPNGLRSIGNYAFSSCQQLETPIHIPNSVTNVGYLAFWPRDVSDLLFDSGNENFAVEDGVLYKLDHGVKVEVTMVSRSLRGEYVVPLTVKRIAPYAFNECEDITSIVLPEGLEEIREFAFSGCKGLVSLNIPSTVSDLSGSAIRSVPFEVVHIDPSKPIYYKDGQFICRKIDDEHVEVVSVDRSCEGNLELPENVVRIGDYAFYGCDRLASVAMPESVISIGDYCFYGCEALQTVFIPAGTIGNDAFAFCRKLMSIEIGNNVTDIGSYAFMYCSNVVSVVIPKSVSAIGSHAFQDCKSLSRAVILGGELGSYVFNGCDALEDVHMGLEVTKIPSSAFSGCDSLKKVEIDSIAELGSSAFYSCDGLELVVIESSIIGRYAFEYCANLSNVVLGAGVSDIGDSAFCRCGSLREISIPVNVTNIGRSAFECCSNLRTMVIPENVRMIGSYAFENCKALSCIEIFGGELGSSLFYGCDALEEVYIGSGVSKIAYGAFSGCYTLKTVYVGYGDVGRVKGLCEWPSKVEFVEIVPPSVDGDADATVTGGPVSGFVIRPSVEKTAVEVTIPQGMDAAKVTVEVSPKVASVKPNGAKVKIVSGGADITEFLNVPVADGDGVIELTKATVKEEIVKEAMDAEKGAKIVLDAVNPSLTTPNTRVGLFYQLREGVSIEGHGD